MEGLRECPPIYTQEIGNSKLYLKSWISFWNSLLLFIPFSFTFDSWISDVILNFTMHFWIASAIIMQLNGVCVVDPSRHSVPQPRTHAHRFSARSAHMHIKSVLHAGPAGLLYLQIVCSAMLTWLSNAYMTQQCSQVSAMVTKLSNACKTLQCSQDSAMLSILSSAMSCARDLSDFARFVRLCEICPTSE